MSKVQMVSAVVALIGAYMIFMHIGGGMLMPPVLSGIAFVLIGLKEWCK